MAYVYVLNLEHNNEIKVFFEESLATFYFEKSYSDVDVEDLDVTDISENKNVPRWEGSDIIWERSAHAYGDWVSTLYKVVVNHD